MTVMPSGWDPVITYNTVLMTNSQEVASRRGGIAIKNLTVDGNFQHQPYGTHPLRVEAISVGGYIRDNAYIVPNCVLDSLHIKNMGCRRMDGLHTPELFEVAGLGEGSTPLHAGTQTRDNLLCLCSATQHSDIAQFVVRRQVRCKPDQLQRRRNRVQLSAAL